MKFETYLGTKWKMVFILCLFFSSFASAQNIDIMEKGSPIVVQGYWNQNQHTIQSYIRIQLKSQSGTLQMRSSDFLLEGNPNRKISRGNVSIISTPLTVNKPTDIEITFSEIPLGGTYTGSVEFYLEGNNQVVKEVPITVKATLYEPNRIVVRDSALINYVNGNFFNFLLPVGMRQKGFSILLENTGDIPAEIDPNLISLDVKGESSNILLDNSYFVLQNADELKPIPAGGRTILKYRIARKGDSWYQKLFYKSIPPDTYHGDILIKFKDSSEVQNIYAEMEMDSRKGLGWALLALLVGVILGKIIKDMSSPKAELQVALMGELTESKDKIDALTTKLGGKDYALTQEYDKVLAQVNQASAQNQEDVKSAMAGLNAKIATYEKLADHIETVGKAFEGKQQTNNVNSLHAIGANISTGLTKPEDLDTQYQLLLEAWATTSRLTKLEGEAEGDETILDNINFYKSKVNTEVVNIENGKLSAVATDLADINTDIDEQILGKGTGRGIKDDVVEVIKDKGEDIIKEAKQSLFARFLSTDAVKYTMYLLMDTKEPNASVRYWFFKPLLTFLTLTVAILTGLNETYIHGGEHFGANGYSDYWTLIAWGIGSKITSSTIGELGEKGANSMNNT